MTVKTALIAGGASGIGLGMARAFAQAGLQVAISDVDEAAIEAAFAKDGLPGYIEPELVLRRSRNPVEYGGTGWTPIAAPTITIMRDCCLIASPWMQRR